MCVRRPPALFAGGRQLPEQQLPHGQHPGTASLDLPCMRIPNIPNSIPIDRWLSVSPVTSLFKVALGQKDPSKEKEVAKLLGRRRNFLLLQHHVGSGQRLYRNVRGGVSDAPKPLFLGAAHSAPARRIQAFLVSGLERTGPGNQGGVTVTYTNAPGHNGGL